MYTHVDSILSRGVHLYVHGRTVEGGTEYYICMYVDGLMSLSSMWIVAWRLHIEHGVCTEYYYTYILYTEIAVIIATRGSGTCKYGVRYEDLHVCKDFQVGKHWIHPGGYKGREARLYCSYERSDDGGFSAHTEYSVPMYLY